MTEPVAPATDASPVDAAARRVAAAGNGAQDEPHFCVICTHPLDGRRRHARCCSGACRADRSRLLRILDGQVVDGAASVHDLYARRA